MKKLIKRCINWPLKLLGLKVIRTKLERLSYSRLFGDLSLLIKKDDPIIFDVGANTGQSIDAFQEAFAKPIIHSFEPSSCVFQSLVNNGYEKYAILNQFALGEKPEERVFNNYEWSNMSSFLELTDEQENQFKNLEISSQEKVSIDSLDNYVFQHNINKINLLKVDTQGFDLNVLRGSKNSLDKGIIDYVTVELNFIKMYQRQSSVYEIDEFLKSNGLHLIDYYEKFRDNHTLSWVTALYGRR